MLTLQNTGSLYTPEEAERIVAKVQADNDADNDDWTYTAVHCPHGIGYSFIEVRDGDGEFLGKL